MVVTYNIFRVGLVWLHSVLQYPKMQSEYGMVEAYDTSSSLIAPVLTWDNKITVALSLIQGAYEDNCEETKNYGGTCNPMEGGVTSQLQVYLARDGLYNRFVESVGNFYNRIPSESSPTVPYALPR